MQLRNYVYTSPPEIAGSKSIELKFYIKLHTKQVILETFPKQLAWYEKNKT